MTPDVTVTVSLSEEQAEAAFRSADATAARYYEDLLSLFKRLNIAPPATHEEHDAAIAKVKWALDAVRVTGYGARVTGVADRVSGGGDPGDEALGRPTTNEAAMIAEGSFRWGRLCLQRLEQLGQIATAPDGVDAGSLISKADKALLADLGLVVPKYGDRFRLTEKGLAAWRSIEDYLKRLAGYWWQEGDARSEPSHPTPSPFEASPEGAGERGGAWPAAERVDKTEWSRMSSADLWPSFVPKAGAE